VVNGSLWTLPTELKCYVLCAIVALLVKIVRSMVPLYFLVIGAEVLYLLGVQGNLWVNGNLPISTSRLLLIFFTGALVSKINFSYLSRNLFLLLLAFLGFITILWSSDSYAPFFYWILVPAIAFTPTRVALAFDFLRSRDFSYGFYLWAFPIQQFVMHFGITNGSFSLIILSSLITLVFSIASWYLVEFPAMKFARKLLKEN
jgi:peptidoglycan/LPS O-acetylase OafA/YrhL